MNNNIEDMPRIVQDRLDINEYRLKEALESKELTLSDLSESVKELALALMFLTYAILACFVYYGYSSNPAYIAMYDIMLIIVVYVFLTRLISYCSVKLMVYKRINKLAETEFLIDILEKTFIIATFLRFIQMILQIIYLK